MSHEHEDGSELADRRARWARLEEEVDGLADKLGLPIDAGIKEAVVGLHAHGVKTSQSCEGHDDHGHALPMVLIEAEEPPDWQENEESRAAWTMANRAMVEKIQGIVDEWYYRRAKDGETLADEQRLVLEPRGIFGAADLQSASQERLSTLPKSQRKKQTGEYRGEMQKFSAYMRERFLSGMSS